MYIKGDKQRNRRGLKREQKESRRRVKGAYRMKIEGRSGDKRGIEVLKLDIKIWRRLTTRKDQRGYGP